MDFDYKKYSLGKLEEWIHDAISCDEATPQEIYDVIKGVVGENYYTYKNQTERCYELLALLNGNGRGHIKAYDKLICDKDDPSPECQKSWNSFWEDNSQYTEEELNVMCDKAASDQEKDKCREYNLREAEYYNKQDKVVRWQLPLEVDGLTGECYVQLPDDLLSQVNWKEGEQLEWIDNTNGSFTLRKVNVK